MSFIGTRFDLIDQSAVTPTVAATSNIVKPVFMMAASADKGTEDFVMYDDAKAWFAQYGYDISFKRHGQPLLQAANIMNKGGKLFFKRVVAEDALLANVALTATVTKTEAQKRNAEGALIYVDADGQETTISEGNTAVMISTAQISYALSSVTNAKTITTVANDVEAGTNLETSIYPLFVVSDNGRGVSKKKIRIYADYSLSKKIGYTKYVLEVFEGNMTLDTIYFSLNPNQLENGESMDIQSAATKSSQIKCIMFENNIEALYAKVADITKISSELLKVDDIIFGCDKKGTAIPVIKTIEVNDLSSSYGTTLANGNNGAFGECPIASDAYELKLIEAFNGTVSDAIYDLDNTVIDIIPDANYAAPVKRAIEALVTFREDCMFIRDLGIGLKTYEEIKVANEDGLKNNFCATYCSSYDIKDPYTKKQIGVSIIYDLCECLISHFENGRTRPLAGSLHGFVFPNAIPGTLNFCPKVTPACNQKELLDDARINYAVMYSGVLTMETLYTSQEAYSQFSFINNILSIQEVIKAIRNRCPKIRYTFIKGDDLKAYKEDVNRVIDKYSSNFKSISLEYGNDPTMEANKIFYALIKVQYNDFIQSEYFKVIALPTV